jgi:hypothetical protein
MVLISIELEDMEWKKMGGLEREMGFFFFFGFYS